MLKTKSDANVTLGEYENEVLEHYRAEKIHTFQVLRNNIDRNNVEAINQLNFEITRYITMDLDKLLAIFLEESAQKYMEKREGFEHCVKGTRISLLYRKVNKETDESEEMYFEDNLHLLDELKKVYNSMSEVERKKTSEDFYELEDVLQDLSGWDQEDGLNVTIPFGFESATHYHTVDITKEG